MSMNETLQNYHMAVEDASEKYLKRKESGVRSFVNEMDGKSEQLAY